MNKKLEAIDKIKSKLKTLQKEENTEEQQLCDEIKKTLNLLLKKINLDELERQAKEIARKSTTMKILRFVERYGGTSYAWYPDKCLVNLHNLVQAIDKEFLQDD